MGDAAHGRPPRHEVFEKPFSVVPEYETWDTPTSYRRYPGGDRLSDKMEVWRVQNSGWGSAQNSTNGAVSRSYGFEDSPDAEILAPGYNTGKEFGAVGVGRHGNFLQWGFSAPPSKMTQAGKNFFLNCIVYINKFDGKKPLVRVRGGERTSAIMIAGLAGGKLSPSFLQQTLGGVYEKHKKNPDTLLAYFKDNKEYIYMDRTYKVDEELKALGIRSNRRLGSLEKLIELLKTPKPGEARILLRRYTTESFTTYDAWKKWFDENLDRIYFSDVGGYKFLVEPEGYK